MLLGTQLTDFLGPFFIPPAGGLKVYDNHIRQQLTYTYRQEEAVYVKGPPWTRGQLMSITNTKKLDSAEYRRSLV